mmetsp:Transcript_14160/g.48803  ORF Transcript_14160/g.48803 Transcript_14160/m.48803 type:complete len:314 (+) Transcript_14160:1261-2202(+)
MRQHRRGDPQAGHAPQAPEAGRGGRDASAPGPHPPLEGRPAHGCAPRQDAEGHAEQRRRVPHAGDARGGVQPDRRRGGGVRARGHQGPHASVEHGPHRGSGARQPAPQRRHHHAQRGAAQGEPRRTRPGGLPRPPGRQLDEAHPRVGRRQGQGEDRLQARAPRAPGRGDEAGAAREARVLILVLILALQPGAAAVLGRRVRYAVIHSSSPRSYSSAGFLPLLTHCAILLSTDCSFCTFSGLLSTPFMPACLHSCVTPTMASAVFATMHGCASRGSRSLSTRVASSPSMRGMWMSIRITSTGSHSPCSRGMRSL